MILPSTGLPRLLVPNVKIQQRWVLSGFYPAFRARAKLWKFIQRLCVALYVGKKVKAGQGLSAMGYLKDVFPNASHSCALLGVENSYRKIIVQIWEHDVLKAYLKCATNDVSESMILREGEVLGKLPAGTGPLLLGSGRINGSETILQSVARGQMLRADVDVLLAYQPALQTFFSALEQQGRYEIDSHPCILRMRRQLERNPIPAGRDEFDAILSVLCDSTWHTVIQHGDLTPWNMVHDGDENLTAIDWEEGSLEGFPYFDLIYCCLQTGRLIHRWSPGMMLKETTNILREYGVPSHHILGLIRLASLDAYLRFYGRFGNKSSDLQSFRYLIFQRGSR